MIEKYIENYRRLNRIRKFDLENIVWNLRDALYSQQEIDILNSILFVEKFVLVFNLPAQNINPLEQFLFEIQSNSDYSKSIKYGTSYDYNDSCYDIINTVNFTKHIPPLSFGADLIRVEFNKISEHKESFRFIPQGIIGLANSGTVYSFLMYAHKMTPKGFIA